MFFIYSSAHRWMVNQDLAIAIVISLIVVVAIVYPLLAYCWKSPTHAGVSVTSNLLFPLASRRFRDA